MRALIQVALAALASGCAQGDALSGVGEICPHGAYADAARQRRVSALASRDARVAELMAERHLDVCFTSSTDVGRGALVATDGGGGPGSIALLDEKRSDAELAARVAHLAEHVAEPPFRAPEAGDAAGCERAVTRAAGLERAAHEVELRVAASLGVEPPDPSTLSTVIEGYRARCREHATAR